MVGNDVIRGETDGQLIGLTVDISSDGTKVFTACGDQSSRVYSYNTSTEVWDLEYTTPSYSTVHDYGRSIRCNSSGTMFFVTYGDSINTSNPDRTIRFFTKTNGIWDYDPTRTPPNPEKYSFFADTDANMNTLVGTSFDSSSPSFVSSWNGTAWVAKGPLLVNNVDTYNSSGVGMSSDGNMVAIYSFASKQMLSYTYNSRVSNWVARNAIQLDSSTIIMDRIHISSDKTKICFSGSPAILADFGVWTYDGNAYTQSISYYTEITSNDANAIFVYPRTASFSGNKNVSAAPYVKNDGSNAVAVFRDYINPLIETSDDFFVLNAHLTNDTKLRSNLSILYNDDYTPPQNPGTGTVVVESSEAASFLDSQYHLVIPSGMMNDKLTFPYLTIDDNGIDSNTSNITFIVMNFGYHDIFFRSARRHSSNSRYTCWARSRTYQ